MIVERKINNKSVSNGIFQILLLNEVSFPSKLLLIDDFPSLENKWHNKFNAMFSLSLWLKVVFLWNCFTKSVNDKLIYSWPTVFVFWPCYLCPVPPVSFAQNTVTMK